MVAVLQLGLYGIAVVATLSAFGLSGTIVVLAMGAHSLGVFRGAAEAVGAVVVPAIAAFALPAIVLGGGDNIVKGGAAWLLGMLLFLAWLRIARRKELDELLAVTRRPRTEAMVR